MRSKAGIGILKNKAVYLLLMMCIVSCLTSDKFITGKNFTNILQQVSSNGIAATGLTLVTITGGFDMSIGSVMSLSGVLAMMQLEMGASLATALLVGLAVGLITGLANGIFIAYVGINPFITTLATQTLVRGIALGITDTYPITLWHPVFGNFALGCVGMIPYSFIVVLVLAGVFELFLRKTRTGHNIYVCGSNMELGFSQGLNMKRTLVLSYMICGLTASLAGLFLASKLGSGSPVVAEDTTLLAMIAIIIGGNGLSSRANLGKTLIGILILGILNNMMNLWGTMSYFQTIIKGVIIVIVIAADAEGVQELLTRVRGDRGSREKI